MVTLQEHWLPLPSPYPPIIYQTMPGPLALSHGSAQISEPSGARNIYMLFSEAPLTPLVPLFWCLESRVRLMCVESLCLGYIVSCI